MTPTPKQSFWQAVAEYVEVMADARPDEGDEPEVRQDDEDDGWFNDLDMEDR
jgi:hypothetical protein